MEKVLGKVQKEWVVVKNECFCRIVIKYFCLFTLIRIGLSMLTWLYYKRKTEFEVKARNLREYRYFIQPLF